VVQWCDVDEHCVAAVMRPIKKHGTSIPTSLGGDPNHPERVIDGVESLPDDSEEPVS